MVTGTLAVEKLEGLANFVRCSLSLRSMLVRNLRAEGSRIVHSRRDRLLDYSWQGVMV